MSRETLALLVVTVLSSLICLTVLAVHGVVPGTAVVTLATASLTGAFGFAQASSSSRATLSPTTATVTETTK